MVKKMRRTSFNSESGAILPIVIILMLALTITGLAFLNAGVMENSLVRREIHKNQAFHLAEAGIEHLKVKLYGGETEPQISWTNLGKGDYMVEGFYSGAPPYVISTGRIIEGGQEILKKIKITIHKTSIFDYGLFGINRVSMYSNSSIDSYNSEEGSYSVTQSNNGSVGTNSIDISSILLDSNAIVYGDATIGPGGDVDVAISVQSNAEITGQKLVAASEKELLLIDASEVPGLPDWGCFYLGGNDAGTISQSGRYSSMVLDSNAILTIDQDVVLYVEGRMEINSNAQMKLVGGADVVIYLGGELYVGSNGIVNESELSSNFSVVGLNTCTTVSWDSNVQFWGTVYAPNAGVEIKGNGDIYGAIIGNEILIDSDAAVHYDKALINDLSVSAPVNTHLRNWEELS
jgi:hypothetical protein